MEHSILLNENRGITSSNEENYLEVQLDSKFKPLPNNDVDETLSLYDQYNEERDECSKYRLIATINPICSNVLFNMKSEVVIDDESSARTVITDAKPVDKLTVAKNAINTTQSITHRQVIRDTEYSHEQLGNFTYHCGIDIFNNHMLRNDGFIHVNTINDSSENKENFNTIWDYQRDSRGNEIEEVVSNDYRISSKQKLHLYTNDTLLSMKEAFQNKCKEKDGWWGFTNPGNIEIPNSGSNRNVMINRMMTDKKACEFIDLFPDRSLFSFVPKYNKTRGRIERNWDYCLTYPYKKDSDMINTVCGGQNGAIRIDIKDMVDGNSQEVIQCTTYFKHTLKSGDKVYLSYYDSEGNYKEFPSAIKVKKVGDSNNEHKDRVFVIRMNDITATVYNQMKENKCFYKKSDSGNKCSYYFRKFKKIDGLRSDINKVAFANNIYGDRIAQILFTDDINLDGMLDHNGRPVSEVYLTIVKRNNSDESSRCFGKVTSGLDFSGVDEEPSDYNIHRMHNIDPSTVSEEQIRTAKSWGDSLCYYTNIKTLEDDIKIEDFDEFYGDIVEFSPLEAEETVIGNVYHRFNTEQRESFDENYKSIYEDVIIRDDYDIQYEGNAAETGFKYDTYYVNDCESSKRSVKSFTPALLFGNICPEGYYYNPHYRIVLRENNEDAEEVRAKYINYSGCSCEKKAEYTAVSINNDGQYKVLKGDYIGLYNKTTDETSWCEVESVSGGIITINVPNESVATDEWGFLQEDLINPNSSARCIYAFWTETDVPTYARYVLNGNSFTWKPFIAPSEMPSSSDLFDMPFTNGRFYIQKNINFFLRRQDPYGKYGLSTPRFEMVSKETISNRMQNFSIIGYDPIDLSQAFYVLNNTDPCI